MEHLLFRKLCARWVPKQLTPVHKAKRMESALTFLSGTIMTAMSFWTGSSQMMKRGLHTLPQKIRQQSIQWRHSGSTFKMKFKQTFSAWKLMCTISWDRRGILLVNFLTRGETVNAEHYCETLQTLRRAIQNKRHGIFCAAFVLLHGPTRRLTHLLLEFCWEVFNLPLYSTDRASSDFHLFVHLKKFRFGQRQHFH